MGPVRRNAIAIGLAAALAALALPVHPAAAQDPIADLIERLTSSQQRELKAWREARAKYEAEASAYWSTVSEKRTERRKRIRDGTPATADDYVTTYPPEYQGPRLTPELAALLALGRSGIQRLLVAQTQALAS
jgi:hypothetical protein